MRCSRLPLLLAACTSVAMPAFATETGRLEIAQATATPDLEASRGRLKQQLVDAAANVQTLEATLTALEDRITAITAEETEVQAKLFGQRGKTAALLSALLKMGRNPPPAFVTHPDDTLKMVRGAILMATKVPELNEKAISLAKDLERHQKLKAEASENRRLFTAKAAQIREAQTRLSALVQTRNAQAMHSANLELAALARDAGDLNDLISKLNIAVPQLIRGQAEEIPVPVTEPSAPAPAAVEPAPPAPSATPAAVAQAPIIVTAPSDTPPLKGAQAESSAEPAPAAASPPDTAASAPVKVAALPPPMKPGVIEVAPSSDLSAANAGRIAPAIRFGDARAKLPLPAQGRFVASFGETTQHGGKSKGIVIETRRGAQITSPCDGWVLYANEFRSYGQLLIINAGDGYLVLLAGLSQVDVQPGQFVLASEPVGTMSSTVKGDSSRAGGKSPVLYVEFRKDGRPVDPTPWWAQQKVQG